MTTIHELNDLWLNKKMPFIDEETGEVLEGLDLEEMLKEMSKEKLESLGCYIKNEQAFIDAMTNEIKALQERREKKQKNLERVKNLFLESMRIRDLKKFETPKVLVTTRKSTSVELVDGFNDLAYMVETITYKADKKAIKEALLNGEEINGARIVTNTGITFK